MMLSKFTTFTDVCKCDLFQRGICTSIFNILLVFAIFTYKYYASFFQFLMFLFAKLTIKFWIIYDNA